MVEKLINLKINGLFLPDKLSNKRQKIFLVKRFDGIPSTFFILKSFRKKVDGIPSNLFFLKFIVKMLDGIPSNLFFKQKSWWKGSIEFHRPFFFLNSFRKKVRWNSIEPFFSWKVLVKRFDGIFFLKSIRKKVRWNSFYQDFWEKKWFDRIHRTFFRERLRIKKVRWNSIVLFFSQNHS